MGVGPADAEGADPGGAWSFRILPVRKGRVDVKVYGVEIVPQAIDDARHNAEINGITNAEFFVGKAEEVVPDIYKKGGDGSHADIVVVDPPRKGCDQVLLDTLVHMA
ncbi:methyltransferase domain-containing protein, partial [Desulfovibrio sp.]|uniref:methyltransferase domain-containing protein n=1 Tax=Desulfovibrio sp. TaxID=885 RepID=UPI00307C7769